MSSTVPLHLYQLLLTPEDLQSVLWPKVHEKKKERLLIYNTFANSFQLFLFSFYHYAWIIRGKQCRVFNYF